MFFFKYLILFLFFKSSHLLSNEIISDSKYYDQGVFLYKNAEFDKAYIVFFNLASKGDTNSQYNLMNMYSSGIGTTQDFKEALR